jgi:hypothetical protein
MCPTSSEQIERHIRSTREQLRSNLDELEDRVKSTVSWRKQFRRNPALGVGLAVGAGFLLAILTTRPRRQPTGESLTAPSTQRRAHVHRFWDNLQSTLLEIAAVRATGLLTGLLRRGHDSYAHGADVSRERGHEGSDRRTTRSAT